MAQIPESIDQQIQILEDKRTDELLDVIGAFALSQQPEELRASLAIDGIIDATKIRNAGRDFIVNMQPIFIEAVCGPDGIAHYMDQPTVRDIVTILLPALGISITGMVPTAIIALCLIIARAGVREFCRGKDLLSIT